MGAQEIRDYVQERYIEPKRKIGQRTLVIRAGDIHDEMGLKNRQPLVCETLKGNIIQEQCNVKLMKEEWGKNVHQHHAKNIWYTYKLL